MRTLQLLILSASCSAIASGQLNVTGFWIFNSTSSVYGITSTASGQITQSGNAVSGQLSITGTPCATTGAAGGTITDTAVALTVNENGQAVIFTGSLAANGNSASGTYTAPAGGCTNGDAGKWSGSRITAPTITGVTSAADYSSGFTLEGYTAIFGYLLSDAVHSASPPYPATLAGTQIWICTSPAWSSACVTANIVYASPSQVNVLVNQLPAGRPATYSPQAPPTYFFASSGGVTGSGALVTYNLPATALFTAGYDCYTDPNPLQDFTDVGINCGLSPAPITPYQARRAAITDLNGAVIWSGNPARINGYYTMWVTGLGLNPPLATVTFGVTVRFGSTPSAAYVFVPATVTYTGEVPQFPGLYQINFQLPSGIANPNGTVPVCGSKIEVLSGDWLPVVISSADVACTP